MTPKQEKLIENYVRQKVKKMLKENPDDKFESLNLDERNRTGIYDMARMIIQNSEILQNEMKKNNPTREGIEGYINILEDKIKRLKMVLKNN